MRLLVASLLVVATACTRLNPTFGAGETEDGSSSRTDTSDPSIGPGSLTQSSDSQSSDSLTGAMTDAEGSASLTQSSTDPSTTGTDGSETTGTLRHCCSKHTDPGCEDPSVESCVCDGLPACCEVAWSGACVEAAGMFCNAGCASSSTTGTDSLGSSGPVTSDVTGAIPDVGGATTDGVEACCDPNEAVAGCAANVEVQGCVCEYDPACCEAWSETCVAIGVESCGLVC